MLQQNNMLIKVFMQPNKKKQKKDFFNDCSINKSHTMLNADSANDNHAVTNSHVDCLSESDRDQRNLSTVFNDQVENLIKTKK